MYQLKRTEKEIDDCLNSALGWEDTGGSAVPGMSYEQGVKAGISWVVGGTDDHPIEEDAPEEDKE